MSSSSSSSTLHHYSLDEIMYATKNFDKSNLLGSGGVGKVYLATVILDRKMTKVAVRILNSTIQEFEEEIKFMSKIQHPNLVSPLGYCHESGKNIIVHEYMEKGSLYSYLNNKSPISLPWPTRIRICLDVARGLQHLHTPTDEFHKGIIHRDVKPSNILLGKDWIAKVADAGIAVFSQEESVGTI